MIFVVEDDSHASRFDKKHPLGELNLTRHKVVDVRGDHITAGAIHVAQLLGEVVRGEELDAFGLVVGAKDECKRPILTADFLGHTVRSMACSVGHV